ncbi:FG-GAP repeat domain-containing protein [Plantactinospora sonchi]|uniref:VCBS repeat-containing protein n=2 Tax=Plantactinospora sonchi TaxID=1544735 RepID=A0ABU7RZ69_9ACTN
MTQTARGRRILRLVAGALAVATAAVSLTVVDAATAPPAIADSSIGGQITRSEVLDRARNWYARRENSDLTYSMELKTWDGTRSRQYRRDCSGFVDMAWHLGSDPNTQGLMSSTYTYAISRGELKPGDLLNDVTDSESGYPYHAILFGGWENTAKTRFWYYSFGGTPIDKVTGASFGDSRLSGHPTSEYQARRYQKIIDDPVPVPDVFGVSGDFSGDGKDDIVTRSGSGELWLYKGTGNATTDAVVTLPRVRIGIDWEHMTAIVAGDFTNDNKADIIARDSDGEMWLYRGTGNATTDAVVTLPRIRIGTGWQSLNAISAGDLTNDGKADLIGRDNDGQLWLYPGTGNATTDTVVKPRLRIGIDWQFMNIIT